MKGFARVSASLLFCLNFALGAAAQDTGAIEGTVTLPTGEPAHRVTVLVAELGRGFCVCQDLPASIQAASGLNPPP